MKQIIFFALVLSATTEVEVFARGKSKVAKPLKVLSKQYAQKSFNICCMTASTTVSFSAGGSATCTVTVSSTVCTSLGCGMSLALAEVLVSEAVTRMAEK